MRSEAVCFQLSSPVHTYVCVCMCACLPWPRHSQLACYRLVVLSFENIRLRWILQTVICDKWINAVDVVQLTAGAAAEASGAGCISWNSRGIWWTAEIAWPVQKESCTAGSSKVCRFCCWCRVYCTNTWELIALTVIFIFTEFSIDWRQVSVSVI